VLFDLENTVRGRYQVEDRNSLGSETASQLGFLRSCLQAELEGLSGSTFQTPNP
jgi:hypothetical protein